MALLMRVGFSMKPTDETLSIFNVKIYSIQENGMIRKLQKVYMGNGIITPAVQSHLQRTNTHQWIDSPLSEFANVAANVAVGTGISPPRTTEKVKIAAKRE
jgi:hypothetical protein